MKISEIHSYRFHKKYKFTPLFWKLSVSTVVLIGVIAAIVVFDLPMASVSVASASDIDDAQAHDLSMSDPSPAEGQNMQDSEGQAMVTTDAAIDTNMPNTTQAGITPAATDAKAESTAPAVQPVPADTTPPVDGLFSKTAFVGDSRTEGLLLYSGIKGATDYAIKGLNLKSVFSNAFIPSSSGGKVTILTDMKNRSFDKIYISFGLNELGWNSETFEKKYSELVDKIREIQPNATIYLQSTFPINPDKCRFDQNTNKRILEMNKQLEKIASMTPNVYYVDIFAQFRDSRGYLPLEASSDGIHLNKKYCIYWLNCLEKDLAGQSAPAQEAPNVPESPDTIPSATPKTAAPVESTPTESTSTESAMQTSDEIKNE